jgi:hypothetical protein
MKCPNCATIFVLRAEYAAHVQQCRPADVTDALLARLNSAAVRLHARFGVVQPAQRVPPRARFCRMDRRRAAAAR